jgi:hypothetical protein
MARQPGAAARIQTAMIIGLALIESLAIYTLVIAIILLFANPFKSRRRAGRAAARPSAGPVGRRACRVPEVACLAFPR